MPSAPTLSAAAPDAPLTADAVVIAVGSRDGALRPLAGAQPVVAALGSELQGALAALAFRAAADEVVQVPTLGTAPFGLVVAAGVGPLDGADDRVSSEQVRRAAGAAIRAAGGARTVHLAVSADAVSDASGPAAAIAPLAEGALLGSYAFTRFRSQPEPARLRRVTVLGAGAAVNGALRRARVVAEAVNWTRDRVNTPPNELYPETFAAEAVRLAEQAGLDSEVLDQRVLSRGGFGGILGVAGGSVRPPRLVRVSYRPRRAHRHVALVGKGVTFDSGGLNLKHGPMLPVMKSDMGGGAAVLAATRAAAALRLPISITTYVPMVENMPSGSSYRPSDVLRLRDGHTVEVIDTDAEGRLILADAIALAVEDHPEALLEASTLTGAQIAALGPRTIGVMGSDELRDQVAAWGRATGEDGWAMPLPASLRRGLDSPVADLANHPGEPWAGMLVAAEFLAEFIPDGLPWVHLDVAGPSWNDAAPHGYTPTGGTGSPVRTLIAALTELAGD